MNPALTVLGASGDLTARHLLPALVRLYAEGLLPVARPILGIGDQDWDDEQFRTRAAEHLADVPGVTRDDVLTFCAHLHYRRADVTDATALKQALSPGPGDGTHPAEPDGAGENAGDDAGTVVYLALPHVLFPATVQALGDVGLPPGSRIVVEKPFGTDQESARGLNDLLRRVVPEDRVFRVDHFLAKQTVLNLLGLRFANRIFEPLWNALHVERVEIVWDETLALEGRAAYYDRAGALQDMIQNHLLQLMCLVAMEPPTTLDERDLRDRKVDLLRAVRTPSPEDVTPAIRGRYTAGRSDGRDVPSYVDEPGVDPAREVETFAAITLFVDNWRWAGVPFSLRTGKALGQSCREIRLWFRDVPHLTFGAGNAGQRNALRLGLDPDRVTLDINLNGSGGPFDVEPDQLSTVLPPNARPPYAQVLLDALTGDPALSIRGDEAEEAWRIMDPVLAAWRAGGVPLHDYPAGSLGPST